LVEKIIEIPTISGVFNCASGVGHSLNDVLAKASEIIGSRINVHFKTSYKEKIKSNVLSIEKARKNLDWYPKHEFDVIFKKLLLRIKE
jgi:UDP-glucose 4-epimerase